MQKILFVTFSLLLSTIRVDANQNIRYCYNCDYQNTIVKKYYNNPVVVAPAANIPVMPVAPVGVVVSAPIVYPLTPVMNCAWYPDPYTFLGEIFGYDYIQVCQ